MSDASARRTLAVGLGLGLALFAVGSVPHLVAAHLGGRGVFTGIVAYNWEDTMIHLGWMKAYQHRLLIPNVFACGHDKPFMLNVEFSLGGALARLAGGNVFVAWHVLRLLGLCAFGCAIAFAVRRYVPRPRRPLAYVLAVVPPTLALVDQALGEYFPSLLVWVNATPIESNTLAYAFEMPQMSLAAALVVFGVLAVDDHVQRRGAGWPWGAIAAVVALWLLHPFEFWTVGVVYAAAMAQLVLRPDAAPGALRRAVGGAVLMAAPVVVYLAADHVSGGEYRRQYVLHSGGWPTPVDLLVLLGIAGALALAVAAGRVKDAGDPAQHRMLATWLLATLVGIYIPFAPFRWHLVNGVQVVVAVLAARADVWDALVASRERRLAVCAGALALAVGLQLPYLARIADELGSGGAPAFETPDADAALAALGRIAADGDCVVGPKFLALDVALASEARPFYLGHRMNLDWARREPASRRFLAGDMDDAEARALVDEQGITHVLCDARSSPVCSTERLGRIGFVPVSVSSTVSLFVRAPPVTRR